MKVLSVTSEAFPLVKTGGLADVAGALPAAFAAEGIEVRTLLPGYPAVMAALRDGDAVYDFPELFGGPARIVAGEAHGLSLLGLDAPHLFDRPGNPYGAGDGYPDNSLRFAAFARAAASIGQGILAATRAPFVPDILHAHDWQAGLAPAYLHYDGGARPGTVMTVHNLAFQGQFDSSLLPLLGLPAEALSIHGIEYYGAIGYLKAGLRFADRITTVSPTYATEICSTEFGMGMEGLLRARGTALSGILNGIDTDVWDPAHDPAIAAPFDAGRMEARGANKAALQARLGLQVDPGAPLFGVISRFSWQKGIDLVLSAIPAILAAGGQLALLGSGDAALERDAREAIDTLHGRVGGHIGYNEQIAHLLQAGVDALLVPSRFEPCGLTQLCALRYGAVPVVTRVGGLVDTVIDASPMALAAGAATGVQFSPSLEMLEAAIGRATALYRDRTVWRMLQRNGMATDVSWAGPARTYAALFREVLARVS
jgi:starch synthase